MRIIEINGHPESIKVLLLGQCLHDHQYQIDHLLVHKWFLQVPPILF
jgi:hypothetical protein